jgi:5-methylcytosine-specific restriction endonuclease McrA
VNEGRRYYWHKACLDEYEGILHELVQPNHELLERQDYKCAICGMTLWCMSRIPSMYLSCDGQILYHHLERPRWEHEVLPWQDDHIWPLADVLPSADDPLWPWRLSNRQAVCVPCHIAKTVQENTRRALWRRCYQDMQLALPLEAA